MDSDRRLLVIVALALAFAIIPGAYGNNSSEGSVISESDNTASSDSGTSAKGWMDETIVSFLSGVVVALIVSISGNYVTYRVAKKTIDLELDKMHEQERQKEVDKRQQVYSKLRGLLFVVEQLTVIQGVGVMYIGYYTTKYKFSGAKLDIDKVEKWRTDINKNLLDLAKCNQMLWEAIGSAELLFPKIEIADFRTTLFESAKILEPFFQSKKNEVLGSGIANEKELEVIKEKAIKDIHQEVNKNIVVPLDEILSQMRKAESHESGKDLAKGQGEVS